MIFLRKVRRRLLNIKNSKKYIFYGLGEITLIVIGILLALQIGAWNEKRKSNNKEQSYLERIYNELKKDSFLFAYRESLHKVQIDKLQNAIELLYEQKSTIKDVTEFVQLTQLEVDNLVGNNLTIEEIKNSGNIDIFRNSELKIDIIEYYNQTEDISEQIQEFNTVSTNLWALVTAGEKLNLGKYTLGFHTSDKFNSRDYEFLNSPGSDRFNAFENLLVLQSYRELDHQEKAHNLLVKCINLMKLVKHELS